MGVASTAVNYAVSIANDNSHGYDQGSRWGPNYDCSSLVITAYKKAGVPLTCTYTGNMLSDMLAKGFKNVTSSVNLATGAGLIAGDVLLNVVHHTAMYIGNGQIVQASSNEHGGVTGGLSGDQTGREISVGPYYNFSSGWNYVLRYNESAQTSPAPAQPVNNQNGSNTYTVKAGDTLWGIAEKVYGNGAMFNKIMTDNGLTNTMLRVGQILKIGVQAEPAQTPAPSTVETCTPTLKIVKYGTNGMLVRKIQSLLVAAGYTLDIDGDYGSETKSRIIALQAAKGIPQTGNVDAKTYEALLS